MNITDGWRSYPEWEPPKWGNKPRSVSNWLEIRRTEGDGQLWRIHDRLYDLKEFINRHPGGAFWLKATQGTDITEAFESHHLTEKPHQLLTKFYVREAPTKRNCPFTFHPEGFYMTLKARVRDKMKGVRRGPATQSKLMLDSLLAATLTFSCLTALYASFLSALLAIACLVSTVVTSHNFFHQRDNWRMYCFHLVFLSTRDWRISHALSHHLFPNSLHDLEITMFDPWFQWLPHPQKNFVVRYFSWIYFPLVYFAIFLAEGSYRLLMDPDGLLELVPLVIPGSMLLVGAPLTSTLFWWMVIFFGASFLFSCIGLNAAHHHPDIFHDGDHPRSDRDWGLYQLDAVMDRVEVKGVLPLVLVLFGDHTLHHMFPTLDHAHLDSLYPDLEEVCRQFGVPFQMTTITDLIMGQFRQLARVIPSQRLSTIPTKLD